MALWPSLSEVGLSFNLAWIRKTDDGVTNDGSTNLRKMTNLGPTTLEQVNKTNLHFFKLLV